MRKQKKAPDVQKSLDFIMRHMVMKKDIADLPSKEDVRSIVGMELHDIRKQLDKLEDASSSHGGFAKEIDHVLQRVKAIEKYLNLKPPVGAVSR